MAKKNILSTIANFLVIVSAILIGITGVGMFFDWNFNIISILLSSWSWVQAIVYVVIGASGGYLAYKAFTK